MSERTYVKTVITFVSKGLIIAELLIITMFFIGALFGHSTMNESAKDILFSILFFGPMISFIVWFDLSLHVSYDDKSIYFRAGNNFLFQKRYRKEISMRYDEIDVVADESNPLFSAPGRAFQYVRLYRKNWDGDEKFLFELLRYKKESIRTLVKLIYAKRPETFTQGMLDYLNADW